LNNKIDVSNNGSHSFNGINTFGSSSTLNLNGTINLNNNIISNSKTITPTELGYLDGLTENIQTQLNTLGNTLNNFIKNGYLMSMNITSPLTKIDIGPGICSSNNYQTNIISNGITIDISISSFFNTNVIRQINTWYYIFVGILNNNVVYFIDTDIGAINKNVNIINFRRIGAFRTDNTSPGNIIPFIQNKSDSTKFFWKEKYLVIYHINDSSNGVNNPHTNLYTPPNFEGYWIIQASNSALNSYAFINLCQNDNRLIQILSTSELDAGNGKDSGYVQNDANSIVWVEWGGGSSRILFGWVIGWRDNFTL
jgi:hypothetical protein